MREIKFRAPYHIKDGMGYFTLKELGYHDSIGGHVDLEKAEQFTGLHDKNGKEIYEGDILEIGGVTTIAESISVFPCDAFLVYGYEFCSGFFMDMEGNILERFYRKHPEVIGNIHENPELIKEVL